jgi:hypothetical protein
VKELARRYHVFYILPKAASYGGDRQILGFWRDLLGQNVLELDDPEAVSELIALTVGMTEGTINLPAGIADLEEFDVSNAAIRSVTTALARLPVAVPLARSIAGALPAITARPLLASKVRRI